MPRRRRRYDTLTEEQLIWIVDPLSQHFDPCPFDSHEEARRMARAERERVLKYWRNEYRGSGELPFWIASFIGE